MSDDSYRLTSDPAYYVMAGVFALLTTALPAMLGQPRLMPVVQAVALTVFIAIPVRSGLWKQAAWVMSLWIVLELTVISSLTILSADHMERSFGNGFEYRAGLLAWTYGASPMPGTVRMQPAYRLVETIGVVVGSLATAGLVGNWFLVRAVNLTGFTIGVVWRTIGGPIGLLLSVPLWSVLRITGIAGIVILLSEPPLTGNWSPRYYWTYRRRLLVISLALVAIGVLLGLTAPAVWQKLLPVETL